MRITIFFLLLVSMVLSVSISDGFAAHNPSSYLAAGFAASNGASVPAALAKAERLMKQKFPSYFSATENWSVCYNGFLKRYKSPKGKNLYLLVRWDGAIVVTFGDLYDPSEQTLIGQWWPD